MMRQRLAYGAPTEKCATLVRLGIEQGVFAGFGLDLSVEVIFSGPQLAKAYGEGCLVIGEMGSPPAVTAIHRGADFRLIGGGARRQLLTWLVTRPEIESIEQLKGKKFGTLSPGSCGDWFFRQMLRSHGLSDTDSVEVVGIGDAYPRQVELVAAGELDATLLVEPAVSTGEHAKTIRVHRGVFEEPDFGQFQWCILAANNEFAQREPEVVNAVLEGYRHAVAFAVANPEIWSRFVSRHFGIAREVADRAVAREHRFMATDAAIDRQGLENSIRLQQRLGAIATPLEVADVVNPTHAVFVESGRGLAG